MAPYYQPAAHPSHPDAQLPLQESYEDSYGYEQITGADEAAGETHPWEHTASSPNSEAEYPYYPGHTLLRFEEDLANNYLAIPPAYPPIPADNHTAPNLIGLFDHDQNPYPPTLPTEDVYAQWYTDSTTAGFPPTAGEYAQFLPTHDPSWVTEASYGTITSTYSTLAGAVPSGYGTASAITSSTPCVAPPPQYVELPASAETTVAPAVQSRPRKISRRPTDAEPSRPYPSPTSSAETSSSQPRDGSTKLVPTPRRNATVSADAPPHPSPRANRWKCPHCPYVQCNKRTPDFNRHVATHAGNKEDWVCCGVPLIDAGKHMVPMEVQLAEPFEYQGMFMVGGCWKTFSRKDALARHLRTYAGVCFGEATAPYLPGNKGGAQ